MKEIEIEVSGRVQGVNFRNTIKKFANNNSIKGFVRNREDGSVAIVAQGDKKNLDNLILWINKSPGFSKVKSMNYKWKDITITYKEFTVKKEGHYLVDKVKSVLNLGKSITRKDKLVVPNHLAIILDGNRRWAREKGLKAYSGHYKAGNFDNIKSIFKEAYKLGVPYLSFWAFSTENWKRDKIEVNAILGVVSKGIAEFRKNPEGVRFRHIGRKDRLPRALMDDIMKLEEETKNFNDFNVLLCLDYGGRDEIIRAVNKIISSDIKKIDESMFSSYLDTKDIPDVDFIIRTSGERRTSGFMPFQGAYAEMYFTDIYFPDFTPADLKRAVEEFGNRKRRFGN